VSDVIRELPDGLVLRRGRADDLDQVVALSVDAHGEHDEHGVRWCFGGGGAEPSDWTVVTDGDRVVSTVALLDRTVAFGPVTVPVGQPEWVATVPDRRRRGLMRAQFDVLHEWSRLRGHLLQIITGIPYYYRRLGYGYAADWAPRYRLGPAVSPVPSGWTVDPAGPAEADAIRRLHEADGHPDIAMARSPAEWSQVIGSPRTDQLVFVARHAGQVHGWMRIHRYPDDTLAPFDVLESAADSLDAATALLAHTRAVADGLDVAVLARPDSVMAPAVRAVGDRTLDYLAWYGRIPDPEALLDHLRPLLSDRLAASAFRDEAGELELSLYNSGLALTFAKGEMTAVRAVPGREDPLEEGRAGIAPDLFPALVFGRFDPAELQRRYDDVEFHRDLPLVEALFPHQLTDLPPGP
jgi:hypothetical protein